MNFLAHQHLSFKDEDLRVGNFLGDFVKGSKFNEIPEPIAKGIILHRHIDWYTDNHEIVDQAKQFFREEIGKYAGVAGDLAFDHFLAKNWLEYSTQGLEEFSKETYRLLNEHAHLLDERSKMTLFYMSKNNWLLNYASIQGIERSFRGLSTRTRFKSNLEKGPDIIRKNYQELEGLFKEFYPILQESSLKKIQELSD